MWKLLLLIMFYAITAVLCSCPSDKYMDNDSGTCMPMKGIGDECSTKEECNSTAMLTCLDGKCACDPDTGVLQLNGSTVPNPSGQYQDYFTLSEDTCVGKLGSFCSIYPIGYSYIERHKPRPDNRYCLKHMECRDNACKCGEQYAPMGDKLCGKRFNTDCSSEDPCADGLVCTTADGVVGKCDCPNKKYQVYEKTQKFERGNVCHGLIGAPCDPRDNDSCVSGAECVSQEDGRHGRHVCGCKAGYTENVEQRCDVEFGNPCDYKTQTERCDKRAGLECRRYWKRDDHNMTIVAQVCSCSNLDDVYESESRKCFTAAGVVCNRDDECTSNSICTKDVMHHGRGRCSCVDGFSPSKAVGFATCAPLSTSTQIGSTYTDVHSHDPSLGGDDQL